MKNGMIIKTKYIFYTIVMIFILVSFISIILSDGSSLYDMLVPNYNNHYWDMFTSIYHNYNGTPYQEGVIYPPGANLVFMFYSHFFSREAFNLGVNSMRDSQIGMCLVFLQIILLTSILIMLVWKYKKGKTIEKVLLIIIVFFSSPFLREFSKMNIILLSVVLLYLFLILMEHRSFGIRMISYICLACAVSIKIYPVFLGLFLIKRKKWKETLLCLAIGFIFFFLPFMFYGGIENLSIMLGNIHNTTLIFNESGLGFKIDITNTINIIGDLVGYHGNIRLIGTIVNYLFLIMGILSFFYTRIKWKAIAILSLLMLSYPTFSNSYGVLFLIPSLVLFLNLENKYSIVDYIYAVLFALLFSPMCFGGQNIFPELIGVLGVNLFTFTQSICIIIMEIMLISEGFYNYWLSKKQCLNSRLPRRHFFSGKDIRN